MGMFGHGFGQRLLDGINAMTQRYGEMSGDQGALLRLQQGGDFARQMPLARCKATNSNPTALMQNAEAADHQPGTPDYQQYDTNGVMAPRMLMWGDPSTGGYATPYSGSAGMPMPGQPSAGPISRTIGGKTYYQINGEWYDNPEGR